MQAQRRKLSKTAAELACVAAEKAASGGDVSEELKQLDVCQRLLAALPPPRFHDIYPAFLITAICLTAASMAWAIRVPKTKIHLRAKTTSVTMRLAGPLDWKGSWRVGGSLVRLQEFARLEVPPEFGTTEPLTGRAWLDIAGGSTKLTRLGISRGALVSVTSSESGYVQILTLGKAFQGEIQTAGSPSVSAGRAPGRTTQVRLPSAPFDPPATVTFYDAGRPAIPALLRVSPAGTLKLSQVATQGLSLFAETTNAEQQSSVASTVVKGFTSSIVEGTLTLSDTGEALKLDAGAPLDIAGADGLISTLEIGPTGVQLSFDGEARGVLLGIPGFDRNLKPTFLEYLYNQKKLGFFWGVVTFLWGLIWSGRKLLSL